MKLSIAFPILALSLSLALVGCDDHRSDWVDADAARQVEEKSVPQLVDKARSAEAPAEPVADDAPQTAQVDTKKADKTVVDPVADDEPEVDVDAKLFVKRLVIAHGVDNREPVSPSSTFAKGEADRVYAFIEVGNEDRSASAVTVSFFADGKPERGGVELRVGASPRWRTWAFTRQATEPGIWHVVVRGPKGQELAREKFEIVAKGEAPQARVEPDPSDEEESLDLDAAAEAAAADAHG
jgi:hypothetical protein